MAQTTEEFFAQVNGTLETVVLACTMLLATSERRESLLLLLKGISASAAQADGDSPATAAYKAGVRQTVETLCKGVDTAALAEQVKAAKSRGELQ